jgi:hypothetical protein
VNDANGDNAIFAVLRYRAPDLEDDMTAFVTAGAGFLCAVLWFDLMFDVQTRAHREAILPAEVLASISAYYRRVTTDAGPMSRLVAAMMAVTLLSIVGEMVIAAHSLAVTGISFILAASAVGLAGSRTVGNAVRLGGAQDSPQDQTVLARSIYRDHIICFAAMTSMLVLQLASSVVS